MGNHSIGPSARLLLKRATPLEVASPESPLGKLVDNRYDSMVAPYRLCSIEYVFKAKRGLNETLVKQTALMERSAYSASTIL